MANQLSRNLKRKPNQKRASYSMDNDVDLYMNCAAEIINISINNSRVSSSTRYTWRLFVIFKTNRRMKCAERVTCLMWTHVILIIEWTIWLFSLFVPHYTYKMQIKIKCLISGIIRCSMDENSKNLTNYETVKARHHSLYYWCCCSGNKLCLHKWFKSKVCIICSAFCAFTSIMIKLDGIQFEFICRLWKKAWNYQSKQCEELWN